MTDSRKPLEGAGDEVDALAGLVARFAAPGKLPLDTPGLRESLGVQVLYQKTPDADGSIHMVRFRFVTPDDIEMHVDFDFDAMCNDYVVNMVNGLRASLRDYREARLVANRPVDLTPRTTRVDSSGQIVLSSAIGAALRSTETLH